MKLLCQLNNVSTDDELFALITGSFKAKITQWNYFINWKKVVKNIKPIEKELNLLNYSEIPIHLYDGSKKSDFFDKSDF